MSGIIDCHHHLWDLSMGRHPWVTTPPPQLLAHIGNIGAFRADYGVDAYRRDTVGLPMLGTVHVEAFWDRAADPVDETEWLDTLERPAGIAERYVAYAPFMHPDFSRILDRQLRHRRVVGVRESLRWHPDPQRSADPAGLVDTPQWRAAAAALSARGLVLELLVTPYEAASVVKLASLVPALPIVLNHCANPDGANPASLELWREAVQRMAAPSNVHMKISEPWRLNADEAYGQALIRHCIGSFGPDRVLFGSNFPVAKRTGLSFPEIYRRTAAILAASEQDAIFATNAQRLYQF